VLAKLTLAAFLLAAPALADAPPVGFQIYCLKNDCSPSGASSVPYSAKVMADMQRVTAAVNGSIRYRSDKTEEWRVNVSAGDCEDFAMTKRSRLMRMGYPASSLRLAVGHTAKGEYHAVLVVKTDEGAFVLDNLTDQVLPVSKAKIRISKMASADPRVWG
jgi:predicted transglutaminase-like cysteine proteinase